MALMKIAGGQIFYFLGVDFEKRCTSAATIILLTIYVWFQQPKRKPPDKKMDRMSSTILFVEDLVCKMLKRDIDLAYWIFVISELIKELTFELLKILIHYDDEETVDEQPKERKFPRSDEIKVFEMNKKDFFRIRKRKLVISNVVLSLSTKSKRRIYEGTINMDVDSYNFAIDTCTSESICKHKELYIGDIKPCKHIYIQGVGGKVKVTGYGSIKLRVTDDEGVKHDLIIHNVLYVPESPVNLLSPQKWSQSCLDPSGTGELTVGDTTLLFWNERKATKLIPHHPELGIPIMSVNEGYTKIKAFLEAAMGATFCQPCTPSYLNTSYPIEIKGNTHVIPVEDEELSVRKLSNGSNKQSMKFEGIDKLPQFQKLDLLDDGSDISNLSETTMENVEEEEIEMESNEIDELVSTIDTKTSKHQKELLMFHYRMKHLPFPELAKLAKQGVLPKHLEKVPAPICYPCLMGKQHKRPWRTKGKKRLRPSRRENETFPGANTSTDQMISPFGGLIPQLKGRLMKAKYYAATIFVDHFSDYTYVHLMQDRTADSTLEAKNAYEHLLATYGRKVLGYHADNGRFAERVFVQDTKDKAQSLTFCGVGSHHQNGIAERRIRTLGEDARTMLAHGQHLWPEVVNQSLWPFAYKAAARSRNKFKMDENGLSPEMKMAGIKTNCDIKNEHPLFCPVFVLNRKLQGGIGGIPKWDPRSNAGVYLGNSPSHAGNVALVLSLTTGLVSPQYHVVFDDDFSTVEFIRSKSEPTNWENLCKFHTEDYRMNALPSEDTVLDIQAELQMNHNANKDSSPTPIVPREGESNESLSHTSNSNNDSSDGNQSQLSRANSINDLASKSVCNDEATTLSPKNPARPAEGDYERQSMSPPPTLRRSKRLQELETASKTTQQFSKSKEETQPLRRSSRIRELNIKKGLTSALTMLGLLHLPATGYTAFKASVSCKMETIQQRHQFYEEAVQLNVDGSLNFMHPFTYATQTAGNEVFHFHQAMREPDREDFIEAMVVELKAHADNNHWVLVPCKEIGNKPTIKAIWSLKRKRRPDGSLLKHKARLCAHGGMQIYGENYWDTYAPVVNWISVRIMLSLAIIHKLHTTSIDFFLAFPQAEVDVEIYMEVPIGAEVAEGDYVCKLLKNLYGLKQAAKTWYEHLRDSLTVPESEGGYGFKQSKIDPCIFYKEHITLITWVDDCLIFADEKSQADELIINLQQQFTLTEEEDVSAYLGVKLEIDDKTGTVTMSQPFLIEKIIGALGDAVTEANVKDSPAVFKEILHKDEDGPERRQTWHYRSVIGMLNYLAASTRPDILFAVHQCARFSANPKLSHERAVKRIVRYLKGTKEKGIIMNPDRDKGIQCFVDADFAGGYSNETKDDPVSVFSRTGYVLFYFNCPVLWVSRMQTEISLSTVEAEYVALSQAMRDVIPFLDQMRELDSVFKDQSPKPTIHCSLFEDNNGALELAKEPRYRPRTKHIAIKYHHFREHVKNGSISINPIDTRDQIADQFTKALPTSTFQFLCHKLLGW